jgi:hypothetical protein
MDKAATDKKLHIFLLASIIALFIMVACRLLRFIYVGAGGPAGYYRRGHPYIGLP